MQGASAIGQISRRAAVAAMATGALIAVSPASVGTGSDLADPVPVCGSLQAGPNLEARPGDGVPDPAGRIAFGHITRDDDVFGQVVSIHAIDPDGSDLALLLDCETTMPTWSPDGTRLAFSLHMDDGTWQVATMAADGSDLHVLTSGPGIHEIPTWAPDGTWLAYDSSAPLTDPLDEGFHTTLWRVDEDGSDARLLGDPDTFDTGPRISPDGQEIVLVRLYPDEDWAMRLVIRDRSTGSERLVLPEDRQATQADWSRDGKWIIYNTLRDDARGAQLELMPANDPAAPPIVLYAGTALQSGAKGVFSPDGRSIVFGCATLEPFENGMCLMDADGSDVRVLRDVPGITENHFSWGKATTP
jgi:Tol biopolymer transport system component